MADAIHILAAQYFQLVEPPNLSIPPGNVLVRPDVQTALYERMFDEALTPLPPATYRTRVLKLIIARIEDSISNPEEDEILDLLMDCWGNLVTQPKVTALEQARQLSYIKYTAPPQGPSSGSEPERTVITSESRGLILSGGTTGNRTWEAALHLGSFLASPPGEALVRGKRVIELGAGTGFLSLFCARHLGAKGVVVSDREPALIENIRGCVPFNQNGPDTDPIPIYPAVWEWGTPLERTEEMDVFVEDEKRKFDVALGADLIYDADLVPLLLSTVRDLFENYHVEQFIIAATLRNEETFKTFLRGCGKWRISIKTIYAASQEVKLTMKETNDFKVETLPFESTPSDNQTGFFHSTNIPIRTYRILRG